MKVLNVTAAIALSLAPVAVGVSVAHGADRHGTVTESRGYVFDGSTGTLTCPDDHPGKPAVLKVWSIPASGRQVLVATMPLGRACKGNPIRVPDGACQFDVSRDGTPAGWIAGHKGICGTPTTSTTTGPTMPTSTETTTWPTASTSATSPAPTTDAPTSPSTPTGTTSSTPSPPSTTGSRTATATAPAPHRPTPQTRPTIAPPRNGVASPPSCETTQSTPTVSAAKPRQTNCAARPTSSTLPPAPTGSQPHTGADLSALWIGLALCGVGGLIYGALWLEKRIRS